VLTKARHWTLSSIYIQVYPMHSSLQAFRLNFFTSATATGAGNVTVLQSFSVHNEPSVRTSRKCNTPKK